MSTWRVGRRCSGWSNRESESSTIHLSERFHGDPKSNTFLGSGPSSGVRIRFVEERKR